MNLFLLVLITFLISVPKRVSWLRFPQIIQFLLSDFYVIGLLYKWKFPVFSHPFSGQEQELLKPKPNLQYNYMSTQK